MLITAAPAAIPISTANPPTEAVATEAAQKTPIPEPTATAENPNTKNSTETNEQPKNTPNLKNEAQAEESKDDPSQQSSDQPEQDRQEQSQERQQIEQLKQRDREVRAHEAAHAGVGGQFAGAPQLSFTTGPDGKRYAVSGEVAIDTSRVANDPQATINKMSQVRQAALAPANPSSQDLKVAAIASQIANQALVELNIERSQEAEAKLSGELEGDDSLSNDGENRRDNRLRFTNPVAARRSSLELNRRINESGALDNVEQAPLLSQTA